MNVVKNMLNKEHYDRLTKDLKKKCEEVENSIRIATIDDAKKHASKIENLNLFKKELKKIKDKIDS
jgi:hypothetical protein